ncbi:MAG: dihydropyrimidinase [Candidatus Undinarchaeales archaeon]|jgi:dihydropyrimidinase|nr:dihydropyrimidinase [Candidatus Undinarchaeales archaeon]MDP7492005.1 dihydropyrimidinase [Candidatus Undinarchaeales archaeon]
MDLIIKNGTIVTESDTFKGDIGISDGKITVIADSISEDAERIIDASGKYILPGGIDVHTHMELPFCGTTSADDFFTGSKAAAFGGVTTLIDFAIQGKGTTLKDTIDARKSQADPKVCIDYSLHAGVTDWTERTKNEIAEVIKSGIPSFKFFMIYKNEGWMADDGTLFGALKETAKYNGIVGVHAENAFVIDRIIEDFVKEGKTECKYHPLSRPNFVESEAISRVINLAEAAKGNLYIFHMSTKEGLRAVNIGRKRGVQVFAETGPHYLLLNDEKFSKPDGHLYATCPPIRSKEDSEELWNGLTRNEIHTLATDHCAFNREQKSMWEGNFTKIPFGMPGIETLVPISYSEGVGKGRLSLSQFVNLISTRPAKIFGLFPRKGAVRIGSDADLVIFDPEKEVTVSAESHHMNIDYSPFEGLKVKGWPEITILRGRIICEKGEFKGERGYGTFIPRKIDPQFLKV